MLARLRVRHARFASAFVGELVSSPLATQLVALDLSHGALDEADVHTLARLQDRFPHLRELLLPDALATDAARGRFTGTVAIHGDSDMPIYFL